MLQAQKEHYLNYRKVFHGDTVDIFEKRKKIQSKTRDQGRTVINNTVGPTPFTGMSNMAAVAMASALNKTQQPAPGMVMFRLRFVCLIHSTDTITGNLASQSDENAGVLKCAFHVSTLFLDLT